jgi:hypothetical protein
VKGVLGAVLAGLVLAIGRGTAGGQEAERPALMFVITGQSNAGQQGTARQLGPSQRGPVEGAWYFAPQHTKKAQVLPLQPYGGVFGPELSFGRRVRELCPGREVVIAKNYSGGTSIVAWDDSAPTAFWKWEMGQVGNETKPAMYPRVLKLRADAAAAFGRPVELAGLLYIQVERDSRMSYGAQHYEEKLRTLIAALRRDWDAPTLPAIFMDSHTNLGGGGPAVHEAVARVAKTTPGTAWVPVRDLEKKSDRVHFATAGVWELGVRMAEAWAALQGCE